MDVHSPARELLQLMTHLCVDVLFFHLYQKRTSKDIWHVFMCQKSKSKHWKKRNRTFHILFKSIPPTAPCHSYKSRKCWCNECFVDDHWSKVWWVTYLDFWGVESVNILNSLSAIFSSIVVLLLSIASTICVSGRLSYNGNTTEQWFNVFFCWNSCNLHSFDTGHSMTGGAHGL